MPDAARTWPCAATTCRRALLDHELDGQQTICTPCLSAVRTWLQEIPLQLVVLGGSRQRETTGTAGGRSTRITPPLPGRDDVLNLLGPAAWTTVRDEHRDQHGPTPIAGVLGSWVRIISEERTWDGPDIVTPEVLAQWLARERVLDWVGRRPWAGEYRDELHALMRTIRGITRLSPQRRPVPQPCPRCDTLTLIETDHEIYTDCSSCESRFTRDELKLAARIATAAMDAA
ncbi:hypothetical protein [Streptomyces prunicolor]|uniref:hypothetical protein n=1 Tax=Streptomyces prunicolor TaxID=67348 RepID=UPI0033C5DAE3